MTDLRNLLSDVKTARENERAAYCAVGMHLMYVMNDVTTGAGWHAHGDGTVLFAPGCEIQVRPEDDGQLRIDVVRGGQHTRLREYRVWPASLLPALRDLANAVSRGDTYDSSLMHDQPWLTAFASWLNNYVDQIEGKDTHVEVTP